MQERELREQCQPFTKEGKTSKITLQVTYTFQSNDDRWPETRDDIDMYVA